MSKPFSFGVTAAACFTQMGRFDTLTEDRETWRSLEAALRVPENAKTT